MLRRLAAVETANVMWSVTSVR